MNPWINIVLLLPAILIIGVIILIRIKGQLENKIYHYRHEGIILQTSLVVFRYRHTNERWKPALGLTLLTGERLVVLDWRQNTAFECKFGMPAENHCELKTLHSEKRLTVCCFCHGEKRELMLNVRNTDAWRIEYSRLQAETAL